jgi:hypothetical protein
MRSHDADPWADWTARAALAVVVVNSYLQMNMPGWAGRRAADERCKVQSFSVTDRSASRAESPNRGPWRDDTVMAFNVKQRDVALLWNGH